MREPLPPQLARVMVLSKPGCHLCEQAEQAVARVCAQTGDSWAAVLTEDYPELADAYAYEVPVIFVDGSRHDYWRVDEDRLRAVLSGST